MGLLRWLKRHIFDPRPGYRVELECPATGEVFANDMSRPINVINDDVYVYDCEECGSDHAFLWGPPAPIHLPDPPEDGAE